jgi:hypothetical protein
MRLTGYTLMIRWLRLVTTRGADLTGVVLLTAALPEHHASRVLSSFRVCRRNRMPAAAVRAVQFIARTEHRILGGEIADSHPSIFAYGRDREGRARSVAGGCDRRGEPGASRTTLHSLGPTRWRARRRRESTVEIGGTSKTIVMTGTFRVCPTRISEIVASGRVTERPESIRLPGLNSYSIWATPRAGDPLPHRRRHSFPTVQYRRTQ